MSTGDATPVPPKRRLPAEWEPQGAIQLTWPHDATDWAPVLDQVHPVFATIAASISQYEPVIIVARDPEHIEEISGFLTETAIRPDRLWFALASSDDTWARDHGAITVFDGNQPRLLDFTFNGWGGKYPADLDDAITRALASQGVFGSCVPEPTGLILEGGSIESDGAGTLLTTTRCLLSSTRNPDLDRTGLEQRLGEWLGAERILWLEHGQLEGDDTDAHIDTLARFCARDTIAYVQCDDPQDPHHPELQAMEQELRALRQTSGEPYRLIPLPWPAPIVEDGRRLAATYANFLILNGAVLLPVYDDPADAVARDRLAGAFPGREIVEIDCRAIIRQGGSLHCLTMQYPAAALGIPQE
ncbi:MULTISPECIES: agmatine/peptidylarginine deiminase [unclassified Thioalkalivibrio]|uniref:agmatine deiminase family protein n=1 Tax=unclassified Thioalkalivibrio TaxID=2621013 RepID=UPI0003711701|nr:MULTISPECIES: agmatine deiminase family protein [unclassified Thioalkalivibrio]